jgi:hypothetical protein
MNESPSGGCGPWTIDRVRDEESDCIVDRRAAHGLCDAEDPKIEDRLRGDCVGCCSSGGGIRSASFSTGVPQAFHRTGLLKFVDYLSTVSGNNALRPK